MSGLLVHPFARACRTLHAPISILQLYSESFTTGGGVLIERLLQSQERPTLFNKTFRSDDAGLSSANSPYYQERGVKEKLQDARSHASR